MKLRALSAVVDLAIKPEVGSIEVAERARMDEGVIQRRVEDRSLIVGSAIYLDGIQPCIPGLGSGTSQGFEIPAAILGVEVRPGFPHTHIRESHLDVNDWLHRRGKRYISARVGASRRCRAIVGRTIAPHAGLVGCAVELHREE